MSARRNGPARGALQDWGDTLRAERQRRRMLGRRFAVAGAGLGLLLLTTVIPSKPLLVWNASPSAPMGLYGVAHWRLPKPGDMVIARLPQRYRMLAGDRHYVPINVPLVKRVVGHAGDEICGFGASIYLNGSWVADRRAVDAKGRALPSWQGCLRLGERQFFLLMDDPRSFDGRYFGVTQGADIIGKATLLWRA